MRTSKKFLLLSFIIFSVFVGLSVSCKKKDNSVQVPTTVIDIDSNVYHTLTIGSQVWLVENLRTTRYNDGILIPNISDFSSWVNASSGGFCSYLNTTVKEEIATYGLLYNWYAVKSGKLAPAGWHVATDGDWAALINSLGGDSIASGKLKETGVTHWFPPNSGATNSSGFMALPGGDRNIDGSFGGRGDRGFWWSVLDDGSVDTWTRYMTPVDAIVYRDHYFKTNGFSVRCVKNN